MDLGLAGKVALVAGSSRGLGRAVAEALAAEGADLALCARGSEALEATRRAIEEDRGVRVVAVRADLTGEGEPERVVREVLSAFGRVDVLVTNTGGPPPGPFEAHSLETWRRAIRQNLESVLLLVRGVLPGMKARGWGRILNITSIAVKQPLDGLVLSNSVRAAVTGLARTLANELAPHGVTVNNLMPGYTRTERVVDLAEHMAAADGVSPADVLARWEGEIPMGRLGRPEELGALAAFLSSEAASYITGQSIAVDGGWIRSLL